MSILIKRLLKTAAGLNDDGQQTFDGDILTIGASSDRQIIVEWPGVQLRHAQLSLNDNNQLLLKSGSQQGVTLRRRWWRNKTSQETILNNGQAFELGNHRFQFTLEDKQPVLTIRVDETLTPSTAPEFKTRLNHIGISKRRWALGLLAFISLAFVASPMLYRALLEEHVRSDIEAFLPEEVRPFLPDELSNWLLTDSNWNTGDFHPAHQFFAHECTTCHVEPFEPVQKETCMSCHGAVSFHFPPGILDKLSKVEETNCQSCHKEHNGEDKLITNNQDLCIECHQNINNFTNGATDLSKVRDWQDTHPEITFNMAEWNNGHQDWIYTQEDASKPPAEKSGVFFPHDLHLRAEGFDTGGEQPTVLSCNDCHTPETGGALMRPVQMEAHCESCHQLQIDVDNRLHDVKHGDIDNLLVEISGLKGLNTLLPDGEDIVSKQPNPTDKLRLPGKLDKSSLQSKQALTLAATAEDIIEKRGCVTCHGVNRDQQALDNNLLFDAWKIDPVHIIPRWIDEAEFDHRNHLSMECTSCHTQIPQSDSAEDVNIPPRAMCQSCHGDPDETNLSPSHCVDCHGYHIPDHGSMDELGKLLGADQ